MIRLNIEANEWKEARLKAQSVFGFTITGDGYKSRRKRKYNNYIIMTASGPILIGLSNDAQQSHTRECQGADPYPR